MAARLLRDPDADGWERSDFPVVCEDCLGPSPYVRMQKTEYGSECAISGRPFTTFRWKPGSDARYKKTVICREVALAKNVCQVCLLDLEYGLPVQVRDAALGKEKELLPKSDVNKEFVTQQIADKVEQGIIVGGEGYGKAAAESELLRKLARTKPYYKRNRAKICTFWLKGACTRSDCPFRPCNGDTDMPELSADGELRVQNMKDRYYGINDPVAHKMMRRAESMPTLEPPADTSITTLFVGGMDERVDEAALKDHFYSYGEIASIKVVPHKNCAFVTYSERGAAEEAAKALANQLVVKGLRLKLMWGKPAAERPPPPLMGGGGGMPQPPPGMMMLPPQLAMQQQMQMRGGAGGPAMYGYGMPAPAAAPAAPAYPSMDPNAMGTMRAPPPMMPPPPQPPMPPPA